MEGADIVRKRKRSGNAILRACIVAVSILMQAGWLLTVILLLNEYSAWISLFTSLLSAVVVLKLYRATWAAVKPWWLRRRLTARPGMESRAP